MLTVARIVAAQIDERETKMDINEARRVLAQNANGSKHQPFIGRRASLFGHRGAETNPNDFGSGGGTSDQRPGPAYEKPSSDGWTDTEDTLRSPGKAPHFGGFRRSEPKRGAVDGKPAGAPGEGVGDTVTVKAMPNPKPTLYHLLYESDDHGDYRSSGGDSHMSLTSLHARREETRPGARVEGGDGDTDSEEDKFGEHCQSCLEEMDAAIVSDDNYEAREAHLSKALEMIDAACKSHRQMKRDAHRHKE